MKKIVLIDDNIEMVLKYFGNIYKMLWKPKGEEGIKTEIIFLGDQFKKRKEDSDLEQKNIDFVMKSVKSMLRSHCRDEEQWNCQGEMYGQKKKLIENLVKHIRINEDDEIGNLVKKWNDKEQLQGIADFKLEDLTPLVDKMLGVQNKADEVKEELYILLDVILFFDDVQQIEQDVPIISMGLYHDFKTRGYNCYLYSSFAFDYLLIDNYKKIYQDRYGEQIVVYHSNDFFSKEMNSKKSLFYQLDK